MAKADPVTLSISEEGNNHPKWEESLTVQIGSTGRLARQVAQGKTVEQSVEHAIGPLKIAASSRKMKKISIKIITRSSANSKSMNHDSSSKS